MKMSAIHSNSTAKPELPYDPTIPKDPSPVTETLDTHTLVFITELFTIARLQN